MQHATAGFRAHILEVQARGIEYHVTLDRAETCGKIRSAGRGVLDVHAAGDARSVQCPFEGSVDLRRTAGIEIGHKTADEPQVQGAIEAQSDGAAPGKLNRTGNPQIGVHSTQRDRVDLQAVLGRSEMDRAGVFQPHICVVHCQAREIGIHDDALRLLQRTI